MYLVILSQVQFALIPSIIAKEELSQKDRDKPDKPERANATEKL